MEDEIKERNRKRAEIWALKSFRDRSLRQMEERDGTVQSRCIDDVQVLLKSICRFCREHGCYVCCRDMGQYAEPADNQR